jgi:uncharacterized CHY-type Zn-finger protein
MSSKNIARKQQIMSDIVNEQMSKIHKELISKGPLLCKTCKNSYKFIVENKKLSPCPFCNKKQEGKKEEIQKPSTIKYGKSFADALKS